MGTAEWQGIWEHPGAQMRGWEQILDIKVKSRWAIGWCLSGKRKTLEHSTLGKECYLQNKDNTGSQSDHWDQNMALYQSLKSHASTKCNDTEDSQHFLRIYFVPGTVLHTSQILAYLVFARWKFTPSSTEGIKREAQSHVQSPSG